MHVLSGTYSCDRVMMGSDLIAILVILFIHTIWFLNIFNVCKPEELKVGLLYKVTYFDYTDEMFYSQP